MIKEAYLSFLLRIKNDPTITKHKHDGTVLLAHCGERWQLIEKKPFF